MCPGFSGRRPLHRESVPCWSRARDGAHRLSMAASRLVDQGNAPPGAAATAVLPHLVSGYREAAEALLRCRERLLAPGSEWRWTLEHLHAPRILVRDTLTYGLLLSETLEAEPLESAQHRRMMLRKALRSRGQTSLPAAVLRNEFRSLLGLHIPRFTALPGTRTLAASGGRALSPGYLSCPPAEAVLRGIGELSAQGLSEMHVPGLLLTVLRPPS